MQDLVVSYHRNLNPEAFKYLPSTISEFEIHPLTGPHYMVLYSHNEKSRLILEINDDKISTFNLCSPRIETGIIARLNTQENLVLFFNRFVQSFYESSTDKDNPVIFTRQEYPKLFSMFEDRYKSFYVKRIGQSNEYVVMGFGTPVGALYRVRVEGDKIINTHPGHPYMFYRNPERSIAEDVVHCACKIRRITETLTESRAEHHAA